MKHYSSIQIKTPSPLERLSKNVPPAGTKRNNENYNTMIINNKEIQFSGGTP